MPIAARSFQVPHNQLRKHCGWKIVHGDAGTQMPKLVMVELYWHLRPGKQPVLATQN